MELRHRQVTAGASSLHVVESGDPAAHPVLFLHGWPQSWRSWERVMRPAAGGYRAIAVDLPGVGGSTGDATDGSKGALAAVVHALIAALGLDRPTLVGQDVGGMITYAYLRRYRDLARAVIMDVVIPGLEPWEAVLRNPYIWHFGLHAVPRLPERLVQGRQAEYFDYFFDAISADPGKIPPEARAEYAAAYASDSALTAGFDWYRAFRRDAEENAGATGAVETPLLYLRGEHEGGDIEAYLRGLRGAGVRSVASGIVPGAGHFTQEEAPAETWGLIADFIARTPPT